MVELVIRDEVRRLVPAPLRRGLGRRLRAALRQLGRSRSQVTLLLTGDAEIRALNRRYRKLDRATDVLSFHQQELRGRGGSRRAMASSWATSSSRSRPRSGAPRADACRASWRGWRSTACATSSATITIALPRRSGCERWRTGCCAGPAARRAIHESPLRNGHHGFVAQLSARRFRCPRRARRPGGAEAPRAAGCPCRSCRR